MSETDPNSGSELDSYLGIGMVLGLVAGAVFIVFETLAAGILGPGFLGPLQMIGAILLGPGALQELATPAPVVGVGLVIHFLLSTIYGGTFAAIAWFVRPVVHNRWLIVGAATLFGLLLWVVNFYVISPVVFPWFGMANPVVQFLAHTLFYGAALGLLFAWWPAAVGDRRAMNPSYDENSDSRNTHEAVDEQKREA